jgi:Na+-transporting NADH:ubiquinone oxidoreductase subunit NqrE
MRALAACTYSSLLVCLLVKVPRNRMIQRSILHNTIIIQRRQLSLVRFSLFMELISTTIIFVETDVYDLDDE